MVWDKFTQTREDALELNWTEENRIEMKCSTAVVAAAVAVETYDAGQSVSPDEMKVNLRKTLSTAALFVYLC